MSKARNVQTYKKGEELPQWVLTQKKTFGNWCNQYLAPHNITITDLSKDFEEGVSLILLLEALTEGKIGKYVAKPKMRVQKLENCSKALKYVQAQGVKLVSIGGEDIVDGEIKLILGLVWMLIQHRYTLMNRKSGVDANLKSDLLKWIRRKVRPYPVPQPANFLRSWQDGKVLYALVDSLKEHSIKDKNWDFEKRSGVPIDDVKAAIQWSEQNLEVPGILDPMDMVEFPDELSNITYLAAFMKYATAEPDPTDPTKSDILNWKKYVVDVPASFTIVARKEDGEQQPQGGEIFDIQLQGHGGLEYKSEVNDLQNGQYEVNFVPTKIGRLLGTVALPDTGTALKGSPLNTFVIPAGNLKFEAYGSDLTHAHANRPLCFNIRISNEAGPVDVPADCVEVALQSSSQSVSALVKAKEIGLYDAGYQLSVSGQYQVICTLFGDEVGRYDLTCYDSFDLSLVSCFLTGEGVDGGELPETPVKFTAELKIGDKYLPVNQFDLHVRVEGPFASVNPLVIFNSLGNFTVEYFPKVMGDYTVTLSVHGGKVADAHPSFTIGGLKCIISGPGIKGGSIKRPLPFKVGFYDSNGKVAGSAFKALDEDNSGKLEKGEVKQFCKQVASIPKVSEMFDKLLGDYKGLPEEKLDKLVEVIFQKYDADNSGDITMDEFKVWGSAIPFIETLFAVTNGQLEVKITGPDTTLNPSVKDSSSEPGAFDVLYQPKLPGEYQIQVFVNHRSVLGEPVVAYCIDTDLRPEISGNGIEKPAYTKRPLHNTLRLLDDDNKPFKLPPHLVDIAMTGPTKLTTSVNPQDNVFSVNYHSNSPGEFDLQTVVFGEPLGAPVKIAIVDRKPTNASTSSVVLGETFVQNRPGTFLVEARTAEGTRQDVGGDIFAVVLTGEGGVKFLPTITDRDDGTYTVNFTPTVFGKLHILVTFSENPIKDNPILAYVLPEVPFSVNAYGKGLEGGFKNYPQRFFVELLDSAHQRPLLVPNDCFSLTIDSPTANDPVVPTVKANEGTFEVTFTPKNVGDYIVKVGFFGNPSWESPVPIRERPLTVAHNTVANEITLFPVNVPAAFGLVAMTEENVPQTVGGDLFNIVLTGEEGPLQSSTTDVGDGTYTVEFTPSSIGKLDIDVKFDNKNIKDAPFSTFVIPGWSETCHTIEGPKECFAFIPVTFDVFIHGPGKEDVLPIPVNCLSVNASIPNATKPVPFNFKTVPKQHGEYQISLIFEEVGDYDLSFALFGRPLETPRHLKVTHKHPALLCSVSFTQGMENAVVRVPSVFTVVAKDVHGADVTGAKFVVTIQGASSAVPAQVKDLQNGQYEVTYKPKEAGKLDASVQLDGVHVVGSPFTSYAVPSDCMICLLKGKGSIRGVVNLPTSFDIVAYLQSGDVKNPVPLAAIAVDFTGPEEVKAHISPSPNQLGVYVVAYTVKTVGIYTIKARVFGREIGETQVEIVTKEKK